ncbi:hypothetical protein ONS95_009146 [Cadophora gregata]|uniref:uncharacterized protein n=1 Tax=Cadophora gregata TaxID=51156 RepID=UPI0026DBA358|nr:uncharacterized protein ONS95_009146 [Cadophora gregata]KAK0124164.1 hypothetical protein ONS95_009146 [Cadophora gregata]KAK0130492.1 hypothetical protein ONS96_001011 [Cadophora gregata f. sp. sojae]
MERNTPSIGIDGFADLGSNISFYESEYWRDKANTPPPNAFNAPRLIVLCTWLGGATTSRIRKYTARYQQLFPSADILLIRTTLLDITLRSFTQIRARLAPARDVIRRIFGKEHCVRSNESVLLHMFSHGGCNTALQLLISLQQERTTLPLKDAILDCCPGDGTFQRAYDAAVISLPAFPPVQMIGRAALYPAIGAITGLQQFGVLSSVTDLRHQLNDSTLLGPEVRRLYLYSATDRMVNFEDVQSHQKMARALQYPVGSVLFQNAQHCALVMEDDAKYWAAIEKFWNGKMPTAKL